MRQRTFKLVQIGYLKGRIVVTDILIEVLIEH
jgi:hypothetical protein